jgi:hypothetical protein
MQEKCMSKKRFSGVRIRVEGERATHASRVVAERGYTIKQEGRLGDDTGYIIRTVEGPVINLYDTGSILISGNGRREFGSVDELRPPNSNRGMLLLTTAAEDSPELAGMLESWGLPHEHARFSDGDWMRAVATARGQGQHILIDISANPSLRNGSNELADPEVYYGMGLIVARISRDHVTVVCQELVRMPHQGETLDIEVMRYSRNVRELQERMEARMRASGVLGGKRGISSLFTQPVLELGESIATGANDPTS